MRVRAALVALACVACKETPPTQGITTGSGEVVPGTRDAAPALPIDWAACEAAVTRAEQLVRAPRTNVLLDGCQVCGDWDPILRWNIPTADGGPKRADIEAAMERCNAFCIGEARMKFLGTLDDARGRSSRAPWKQLALVCKDRVSATANDRFADGIYFAYDRIARAVFVRGGDLATRVEALELPLPLANVTGTTIPLPAIARVETGVGDVQITVLGETITVGMLPRARLTRDGVKIELGSDDFPGKAVTPETLGAELTRLLAPYKAKTVVILAPAAMRASRLLPVIAAAAPIASVSLAARDKESPDGWDLPATVSGALEPRKGMGSIRVTAQMTVQELAEQVALQKTNPVGIWGP